MSSAQAARAAKKEWLDKRRIGGSTAAKVLGVSSWGGPPEAYDEIMAALHERSEVGEETPDMVRGHRNEEPIARDYEVATGRKVHRSTQQFTHDTHLMMTANIDRHILGTSTKRGTPGVLECKCPRAIKTSRIRLTGKLPADYIVQLQHNMFVTSWTWGSYAIESAEEPGVSKLIHFDVDRDDEWCNEVLAPKLTAFWEEHIDRQVRPEPEAVEAVELPDLEMGTSLVEIDSPEFTDAVQQYRDVLVQKALAEAILLARKDALIGLTDDALIVEGAGVRIYHKHLAGRMNWDGGKLEEYLKRQGLNPNGFKKASKPTRPFKGYCLETGKPLSSWAKTQAADILGD